ncbi:MAG: hypothetical protein EOO06_00180 [Chitinophagaceae bacterium]|nr:MAG: hypothetical protein EOO06_00180 [Chitinophagaceae bacterium]
MRYFVFTIMLYLGFGALSAQEVYSSSGKPINEKRKYKEDPEGFDPSKIIWGGGIILSAGSGYANLGISPIAGYKISERFSAGVGLGYQYLKIKNAYTANNLQGFPQNYDMETSMYNANAWARFMVWNGIFAHIQPEINSLDVYGQVDYLLPSGTTIRTVGKERMWVPCMMVGGGIRQPISDRVSFVGLILYDVLKDQNSPYRGIDLRFGINVGF